MISHFTDRLRPVSSVRQHVLLILDDNRARRESLRAIFRDEYFVLLADTSVKAMELAHRNVVDVVISGMSLTGLSGFESIEKLKTVDSDIQFILLKASDNREATRHALRFGFGNTLNSEPEIETLRKDVSKAIERRVQCEESEINEFRLQELKTISRSQKNGESILTESGDLDSNLRPLPV